MSVQPPHQPHRTPEDQVNTLLSELTTKIDDGVKEVEGWVADVKSHIPAVVAKAEEYEANPVVKAIEDAALPGSWVTMVTDFIAKLGTLANSSQMTTPAAPAAPSAPIAPAPAEPDPAAVASVLASVGAPAQPDARPVGTDTTAPPAG